MSARVFVDMDGVVVDFDSYKESRGLTGDEVKKIIGAYLDMPAIAGAIEAVRSLIGMGFEVWLATKPPTGVAHAYSDKAAWVFKHLPELKRRIVITHDKGLLGNANDFLCDDRPQKANCEKFSGTLLRFVDGYHWPEALAFFRGIKASTPPTAAGASTEIARNELDEAERQIVNAITECNMTIAKTNFAHRRIGEVFELLRGYFSAPPSPEDDATVRVPREPTEAMIHQGAASHDHPSVYMGGPSESGKRMAKRIWAAMIAAAESGE